MSRIILPTGTRGWTRAPGYPRRRDLLFGFRADGLELVDLATGRPLTFTRASPGGLVPTRGGRGASRGTVLTGPAAHDLPRFAMVDRDGDGAPDTTALALERAVTNLVPNPVSLTNHTIVTAGTGITDLGSGIANGVATVHFERVSMVGGDRRYIMPTFEINKSIPHVFALEWRHVAGEPRIDWTLRGSAVDAYPDGQFSIASRQASGEWTAGAGCTILRRIPLADGFERLLVRVSPAVWNGSGDGVSSQVHHRYMALGIWHYQYRRPQAEIGTAGTSFIDGTRAREILNAPWDYPTTMPWTAYLRTILPMGSVGWTDGITNRSPVIFVIGGSPFSASGIGVHCTQTATVLQMRAAAGGSSTALPDMTFTPSPGSQVEVLARYTPQPNGTATGFLAVSIEGATAVTSSGSLGPVPASLTVPLVNLNGYGNATNNDNVQMIREFAVLYGSWTLGAVRSRLGIMV